MADGAHRTTNEAEIAVDGDLAGVWVLDRFLLRRELPWGSYGRVWLARERGSRASASVEIVDADGVEQARQEAEALAGLDHPNVPSLLAHGPLELRGERIGWCVAVEHVDGVPLSTVLGVNAPQPPRAVAWARQLASALAHCHEHRLVHGGVGAESVVVARDARGRERMVLTGFGGVARVGDPSGPIGFRSLEGVQTVAPEQIRGETVDGRTDVYALGALLYRMLVDHAPFARSSAEEVLTAHLRASVPPLGLYRPTLRLPPGVEDIVVRCLARNPEDRFATAAELEIVLAAAQYAPQRDWVRVTGLDLTLPPEDDEDETVEPGSPASSASAIGWVLVLLAAAAVCGALLWL